MKNILRCVHDVRHGGVKRVVRQRVQEFKRLGRKSGKELFKELCFCILTANYTAEGGMRIQKSVGSGFLTLSEKKLAKKLKQLGHRFPNTRADYIVKARKHKAELKKNIRSMEQQELRDWLVRNVKGLGCKEASHFLRNIGFEDVAIVDFHIIDFLARYGAVKKPKVLTKKRYFEIEELLRKIARRSGMSLGEIDLYMWYCETGKVLK